MSYRKSRCSLRVEVLESRELLAAAVALTTTNELLLFDTDTPDTVSMVPITGLQAGERVLAMDFRPADLQLYAISNANRVLTLNRTTGAATQVGQPFTTTLVGGKFGMDFNPVVDRIRLVSDADQNLRLHPVTGQVAAVDGMLWYSHADAFVFTDPNIVAAAYLNNFDGAQDTLLFVIDSILATLAYQSPPNDGILNTVGSLAINTSDLIGFDVLTFGEVHQGYVIFSTGEGEVPELFLLDLFELVGTPLGTLNTDRLVLDLAMVLGGAAPGGSAPVFSPDLIGVLAQATAIDAVYIQETALPAVALRAAQEPTFAAEVVEEVPLAQPTRAPRGEVDNLFADVIA